jgi:predicted aspartyl protease
MTVSRFISTHFPYLPAEIVAQGQKFDIEALVDTGFDGEILIPHSFLGDAPVQGELRLQFADGSIIMVPTHRVTVRIGPLGPFETIAGSLGNEFLIGVGLIRRLLLTLDHGERVIVGP